MIPIKTAPTAPTEFPGAPTTAPTTAPTAPTERWAIQRPCNHTSPTLLTKQRKSNNGWRNTPSANTCKMHHQTSRTLAEDDLLPVACEINAHAPTMEVSFAPPSPPIVQCWIGKGRVPRSEVCVYFATVNAPVCPGVATLHHGGKGDACAVVLVRCAFFSHATDPGYTLLD